MLDIIYAKTGVALPPELITKLRIEKRIYKKNEFITREGQIEKYAYVIHKGGVKVIYHHKDTDYILGFWFAGELFSSLVSFLEQLPSQTSIIAIADTEVERIDYTQIQCYYSQHHLASEVGRKIIEYMFIYKAKKELEIISKTAEERYIELIDHSGHLVLDLPVKEIASYLGIHPESLSRIRRRLRQPRSSKSLTS
jgi:CRP-like cAMP-binding protein